MRLKALPLALLALSLLLVVPTSASAAPRYRVGIGDQDGRIFSDPSFQALELKRMRYIVPWNWAADEGARAEYTSFLNAADNAGLDVFVHFTSARGCWNGRRYSRRRDCRPPSTAAYSRSVRAFRRAFPFVDEFGAWNEANHKSQPTYKSPKRAARYYNAMRRACRGCTILALDLLDSSNMSRYLRAFRRRAKGRPRLWGLHNYSDVNRKRSIKTRELLRKAPGQVWLTETGGIVDFTSKFPYNERRAASRTRYMFKLADRYSRKRRGHRSRITRIYPYQYTGGSPRFDAGLVNEDLSPRRGYHTFKRFASRRRK